MNVSPIRKNTTQQTGGPRRVRSDVSAFQIRAVAYALIASVGVAAIYAAAGAWFFHEYANMAESMGFPAGHRIYRFFGEQRSNLSGVLLVAGLISAVWVGGMALLVSRAVAGSLQRLAAQMRDVADGRTDAEVQPRRREWFPDLLDSVNRLIRSKTRGAGESGATGRRAA